MRLSPLLLALAIALPAHAQQATTTIPQSALDKVPALRERALADRTGWKVVESLTTEVGPRPAGSEADARAVEWAKAKFRQLGYDKVWTEPVSFPVWVRRGERAEVLGAHAQPLAVIALGNSPGGTVEGEVVRFPDLAALNAAPDGSLAGKIAFVDYRMQRYRDGHDYAVSGGGGIRGKGPSSAIRKGAIGFLMRSAGTDMSRAPHAGATGFDGGLKPIPSAALSTIDAEQLARLVALDPHTRLRLALDCGMEGEYTSQNVIGEITGRGPHKDEVVLMGGHLDSWDPGTGAIDDAAGIGISMAAGALLKPLHPQRTIRVVAFANEERGLFGGKAYAAAHAGEIAKHQVVSESDFGAGHIYSFNTNAPDSAKPAVDQIAAALKPLGIDVIAGEGGPESDVGPIANMGATWASLSHDGSRYFDYHHTAEDTLDKIDPKDLAQNVAAYAVFAWLAAQADGGFGSAPKAADSAAN
jgi:hypothetical protein